MKKEEIKNYSLIKKQVLTTSEVIKNSFVNVIKELKENDYVLIENSRQKMTMVVQDINTFTIAQKVNSKTFGGKIKTPEENKLLLRTFIKEKIYYLMKFEFKNITFPNVETIIENSQYYKDQFQVKITNQLMKGFKFILNLPQNLTYNLFLNINSIIAFEQALEWGVLRTKKIGISGTNYIPPLPTKKMVESLFNDFNKANNKYQAAAILLVKLIKAQVFFDGNKRTAFLAVNRLLIENALGILSVNDIVFEEFNILLNAYHNDERKINNVVNFLVSKCIFNTLDKKFKK